MILLLFGVLGSLAAANLAGSLFDLSLRQQLFPAALVFGLTLLALVQRERPNAAEAHGSSQVAAGGTRARTTTVTTLTQLLAENGVLPPEAARKWLDDFLLEQQK